MLGEAAAKNPNTNPSKLARLAGSRNAYLRLLVAANPSTPQTTLDSLAGAGSLSITRAVAANPSASPACLRQLVQTRDASVRAAVFGNPSTPSEILANVLDVRGLTVEDEIAAAANPSTPDSTLALLARRHHEPIILAVAGNVNASTQTLSELFRNRDPESASRALCEAIATNPATPTEVRASLFRVKAYRSLVEATKPKEATSSRVAQARRRFNGASSILELLTHDPEPDVRRAVAVSPSATDQILEVIASDPVADVALVAQARRSADLDELHRLARSNDHFVLEALARNTSIPVSLRAAIAGRITATAGEDLLAELARDRSTPSEALTTLATSQHKTVRAAVASSPTAPLEALTRLARDSDPTIRSQVAKAVGLPTADLVRLASDDDPSVRAAVAGNESAPIELLLRLASDDAPRVAEAVASSAMSTPAVMTRLVSAQIDRWQARPPRSRFADALEFPDGFPLAPLAAAAANDRTPAELLRSLADALSSNLSDQLVYPNKRPERKRTGVLWPRLAANPNVPADVLDSIARRVRINLKPPPWSRSKMEGWMIDLEAFRETVLMNIALNPSTNVATLEYLADADWIARKRGMVYDSRVEEKRPGWDYAATSAAWIEAERRIRTEIMRRRWNKDLNHSERLRFATDPYTPEEVLAVLADDPHVDVRRAVAANSSTSPQSFMKLVTDPADVVRVAAARAVHPDAESLPDELYAGRRTPREAAYRKAFESLAQDELEKVRLAIAKNYDVYWGTLSKSARSRMVLDGGSRLRAVIVGSMATGMGGTLSRQAVHALIDDGDEEIWRVMAKSYRNAPEILERLASTRDSATLQTVAIADGATNELLVRLASGDDEAVLVALASRPHNVFSRDRTRRLITEALLRNPKTPESVITQLATAKLDEKQLELIARHPNFPESKLLQYASGADERWMTVAAMSGNSRLVAAVASNVHASVELLEFIAANGDQAARDALILNHNTPQALLVAIIEHHAGSD